MLAPKRRRHTTAELDELDAAIIAVVAEDSPVSLRGVYYRLVAKDVVGKTDNDYRLVGRQLVKLRMSGDINFDDITDGTRWVIRPTTHDDVEQALAETARAYRRTLWQSQDARVMIFTEKDAITGVIHPVTDRWQVGLGILRGKTSVTFCYEMADTITDDPFTSTYVDQLGDHDYDGVQAWNAFQRTVNRFVDDLGGAHVTFERLAVTPQQISDLNLIQQEPTPRAKKFGWQGGTVQVDAIPAPTLRQIVSDAIEQHIDQHELEITKRVEAEERRGLLALSRNLDAYRDEE